MQAAVIDIGQVASKRLTAYVDEDGILVVSVRAGAWWCEVYGKLGNQPRVDCELVPAAEAVAAVIMYRELTLWAMGEK